VQNELVILCFVTRECKEQSSEKRMWGYHSNYIVHRWGRKISSSALMRYAPGSHDCVALGAMFECEKAGFLPQTSKGKTWVVGSSSVYY